MVKLSTVNCGICQAPTINGYVCSKCESVLRQAIIRAGITYEREDHGTVLCILDELDVQMSRQARMGSRSGGRSAETPIPFDARAAKAHAAMSHVLTSWARHYGAIGPDLAGPRRSAHWLRRHLTEIMTSIDAAMMHADLSGVITKALVVIDRADTKEYIGICSAPSMQGACSMDLYAPLDTPSLTCPQCGTAHDVKARRLVMLDAARGMLLNATEVARITAIYGGRVTPEQIYKWKHRGRLIPRAITSEGHPRYRLGDVLDLMGHNPLHLSGVEG